MGSQDWDIKKRAESCQQSGDAFGDGQKIISRLTFGEEGYLRDDYIDGTWDDSLAEGALSVWRSVVKLPPPPAEEPMKRETVESLLRQYDGAAKYPSFPE